MGLFSFSNVWGGTPEQNFWKWFETNEAGFYRFETNREKLFDELSKQMAKVHPDLTFEFGPIRNDGKREFVISAGGIRSAFPAVKAMFSAAPSLPRWHVTKFRPRRFPLSDIEYGGRRIKAADVAYAMYKDGSKVGIVLFFDDYKDQEKDLFGNIGYLLLDEALGEYDIETKVGFVEFHGRDSNQFKSARPLSHLPANFDEYFRPK
jgi:hypothetical protein